MKILEVLKKNHLDINSKIFKDKDLQNLYEKWIRDITYELPNRRYQGNCTKEFCEILINRYGDDEYNRIQSIEFPDSGVHHKDSRLINEFNNLRDRNINIKSSSSIILKYHKWSLNHSSTWNNLSPYDGWNLIKLNKDVFLKFYRNRLRCSDFYKEKDNYRLLLQGIVPESIYYVGLSSSRSYPRPSYFKPSLTKYLIEKYLDKYDTIFDPFSGFSGRLIGSLACNKNYIGQDICHSIVSEQNKLLKFLNKNFSDLPNVILRECDSTIEKGNYECLLTCSPYSLKENWPNIDLQNHTCDEWIDMCLNRYTCDKYVFITDDLIYKYKDNIVETLENTSHFYSNKEYVVVI